MRFSWKYCGAPERMSEFPIPMRGNETAAGGDYVNPTVVPNPHEG